MRRFLSIVLAVGLVLSFSLVTAVPVLAFTEVWVDDDAPGDPGPGDPSISDPLEDGTQLHPFDEIQEAIDYVYLDLEGGIVNVAAGTYIENIGLKNGVDVLGAGAGVTTIDGGGSGHVVDSDAVDSSTTIDGFTITGGNTDFGGGMYNDGASPVVSNCIFISNQADNHGGGMYNLNSSSPVVVNCTFIGNSAGAWGGGIACRSGSTPTIVNCIIVGNTADDGGGIHADAGSAPTITNNTIVGNTATNGGGIYADGGINVPTITNNIIASNTATTGGGIYAGNTSPIFDYNDVWSNTGGNYAGCAGGTNALDLNPEFVGGGDYHLDSSVPSPCIDAGDNGAPSLPTTDFDGEPRIYPAGGTVDMGADEYYVAPPPPPPPSGTVGGEVYPVDKAALLMPWLGLGAILILAGGGLILIRRLKPVSHR